MKNRVKFAKLLFLLLFFFFTQASAGSWFGVHSGYPLNLSAHFGFENLLFSGIDLRASANLSQRQAFLEYIEGKSSPTSLGFGLDAMLPMIRQNPLRLYLGLGATVNFTDDKVLTDVHGLAGLEFRPDGPIINQLGIFTEASAAIGSIDFSSETFNSLAWSVGVNWHLP